MQRIRGALHRAVVPTLAVVSALVLGAILIVLTDFDHLAMLGTDPVAAIGGALGGVVRGYTTMFTGAIGDPSRILLAIQTGNAKDVERALRPISESLLTATPYIFAGLGLAISFQAGLFNLGVDGQFTVGGMGTFIAAALVAGYLPPLVALAVSVLGGVIAGGAYAAIAGVLKARTGAHEVITTLMLNGIAPNLTFLVAGWLVLPPPHGPITPVPKLIDLPTIRVDWGIVVALATAAVVSVLLFRSTIGFEIRTVGFSRTAARGAGMRTGWTMVLAMALSGGLVGMASAFFTLGPAFNTGGGPSPVFGYVAIALALLAGRRPSGVVLAALLYGALDTGATGMVITTGIPLSLLSAVVAFAILFVAAPALTRWIWRLRPPAPGSGPGDPAVSM
jgi:general nucleoside transport system permease protein